MTPFAVVVNDDPTQNAVLCGLLRKAGLEARGFIRAEDALADMSAGAGTADGEPVALPALVVTDLYMPGIDGFRLCRLLRSPEYAAFNHVPILVVSATFAGDETDRLAADLGAETFLPSPVNGPRFIEHVIGIVSGKRTRVAPRVLLVDDSKALTRILEAVFAAHGYQTDTAATVQAAADAFARVAYDVAILDYHLPDGTADVLLDAFRATRPDCVCIMITADPGPELALEWMRRGAAAYLRKPFEPDYLIELCAKAGRERALLRIEDLLEARTRELRASEAWHTAILHTAMDGFWLVDMEGRLLDVNETYCRMSGYSAEELRATSLRELEVDKTADDVAAEIQAIVSRGEARFESRHRRKDGSVFEVEISAQYRNVDGGRLVAFLRDITDRRQSEEALRDSEHLLRESQLIAGLGSYVLHIPTGSWKTSVVLDKVLGIDKTHERSLDGWAALVHPDDRAMVVDHLNNEVLGRGRVFDKEYRIVRRDSQAVRWVHGAGRLEFDAQGRPLKLHGTIQDITERKRTGEDREKLQAQLNQAQKMESVGRLAGGVAHDFNNMLGAILGHAELALEQVGLAHPLRADLEEIRTAAIRSADLTRQLLAFARKQTVAPKVLDLNETIGGMLKMLGRLIGEDIQLMWQPQADLWSVRVDPSQVDQILANLCVNARDAIAGVGTMTIEAKNCTVDEDYCADHVGFAPGAYVQLSVSDSGSGMDKETLAHIFEPFFTTKGVGQGTGLGLATVYGAVKQNDGFINVYSEPGHGTTFTIYLPRYVGRAGQALTDSAAAPPVRGQETILLVEDEPAILKLTATMLERQGYTVLAAHTPGEALQMARECADEIHLLMTDVIMPEMNGRDLARNLQSLYPGIARLFMSGYTSDVIAHHGVLDDGVSFIQKPFSMSNLAFKVRDALDRE